MMCSRHGRRHFLDAPRLTPYLPGVPTVPRGGGVVHRRSFLAGLVSAFGVRLVAEAQPAGKVWRIGILTNAPPAKGTATDFWTPFIERLRELGGYAEGYVDLSGFAAELVNLKVDVILAVATGAALAAKTA